MGRYCAIIGCAEVWRITRRELHASFSVQSVRAFWENNMLGTILLVILILLLVGALPSWGYSTNWWLRTKRHPRSRPGGVYRAVGGGANLASVKSLSQIRIG
jgi:hypothetical protein